MGRRLAPALLLALALSGCAPKDEAPTAPPPPASGSSAPKGDISVNPHGNMALPPKRT